MDTHNTSQKLYGRASNVIPSGVSSPVRYYRPYPFFAESAKGCRITDTDGRTLIDMCNGYGALLLGHSHPGIVKAVAAQLEKGTLYCAPTEGEVEVSEMIRGNYPSMEMSRMVNTGGEATMTAIRLARGYTGKDRIVMFEGGYHGAHDSVLVKSGSGSAAMPSSGGILRQAADHTLVAKYNDADNLAGMLEENGDVACVIIEPVMANMGLIPPQEKFLERVRSITRKRDVLLVFDEVVTGFRMSPGGAQEYYGIRPDLSTLAKALGGGFAAAAVGGRRDIMERLAPGGDIYQASTFAGNPVSTAAAIASISAINRLAGTVYDSMRRTCDAIAEAIDDTATDMHIPHQVNHIESMFQIFFTDREVRDYKSAKLSDTERFGTLFAGLLERGVFVPPYQSETVFVSAALTVQDAESVADAYAGALGQIT